MKPMASMALDQAEVLAMECPIDIPVPSRPLFPPGLCICLTDKELAKMGIPIEDFVRDGIIHIHAMTRITDVNTSDGQMGKRSRVELQIESMCIEGEDAENDKVPKKRNPLHDNDRS